MKIREEYLDVRKTNYSDSQILEKPGNLYYHNVDSSEKNRSEKELIKKEENYYQTK